MLAPLFYLFLALNAVLPFLLSRLLTLAAPGAGRGPTAQQYRLVQSFSLLLLGMFLSSLATLNFSLALIVGLLAAPLSFVRPLSSSPSSSSFPSVAVIKKLASTALLSAVSPASVLLAGAAYWGLDVRTVLREAAVAWHVCGTYSAVVVWCVWWPAWLAAGLVMLGEPPAAGAAAGRKGEGKGKGGKSD